MRFYISKKVLVANIYNPDYIIIAVKRGKNTVSWNCKQIAITLLIIFVLFTLLPAQAAFIKGTVLNSDNNKAVADVNIYVSNTTIGTTSIADGSFYLQIPSEYHNSIIVFQHVSFDTLYLQLPKGKKHLVVLMKPRLMQSSEISILAEKKQSIMHKDIPQSISIIESKEFEVQGYIDAGDLLSTDHSVQVEENSDGKKTVAIRGGNPEDVVVLFNGVKMNNAYDNIFDFSLLNLDDIEQVEIIKGSNTTLYGAEAFSGVINIVPKLYRDYTIRFQQKLGTYALGDWNLQLSHKFFNKLTFSYTHKQAGSKRSREKARERSLWESFSVPFHNRFFFPLAEHL